MPTASTYMNFVYDPDDLRAVGRRGELHLARSKASARWRRSSIPRRWRTTLTFPTDKTALADAPERSGRCMTNPDYNKKWPRGPGAVVVSSCVEFLHRHKGLTPYLLLAAGDALARALLPSPDGLPRLPVAPVGATSRTSTFTWEFSNYCVGAPGYHTQLIRSFVYAGIATVACWCSRTRSSTGSRSASGRWQNLFLLFIVAPFFVTYLGADARLAEHPRRRGAGRQHPARHPRARARRAAARRPGRRRRRHHLQLLPLHGAAALRLARADRPAAARGRRSDLYASASAGVPAGDAAALDAGNRRGTLLTFIPAAGDFINAAAAGHAQPVR